LTRNERLVTTHLSPARRRGSGGEAGRGGCDRSKLGEREREVVREGGKQRGSSCEFKGEIGKGQFWRGEVWGERIEKEEEED
jgi:hypothetical protein